MQNLVEKVRNQRCGNWRFVQEQPQSRIPNFSEFQTLLAPFVHFGALQHLIHNLQNKFFKKGTAQVVLRHTVS